MTIQIHEIQSKLIINLTAYIQIQSRKLNLANSMIGKFLNMYKIENFARTFSLVWIELIFKFGFDFYLLAQFLVFNWIGSMIYLV